MYMHTEKRTGECVHSGLITNKNTGNYMNMIN